MTETETKIQTTLEKDYKDTEFIDLLRKEIKNNQKNEFYKEMVEDWEYNVDALSKIDDLVDIPYISTTFYKQSAELFKKLLKIPEEDVKHWNCSSATSGDPSLVGVNERDINFLHEMSRKCFLDFIPRDWERAKVLIFSPSKSMLDRFCMRYTDVRPVRAYSGNYYSVTKTMTDLKYLFGFSFLKALKAIITTFSIVGGFYIKQSYLIKTIEKNLAKPEDERRYIGIGGSNHLINQFMKYMREQGLSYELGDEFDVVMGGGGWDGHKAQMKYDPIDKAEFVGNIADLFGTKEERVVDIYGFTECPIVFGSHWSKKHEDFIFHVPSYARIIIRDISTLDPLKKVGDTGFLEVLSPFGVSASLRHAVIVDDQVELISKGKCPECGQEGDTFRILGRIKESEGIGCSSLITWT
jgi:hypothetical protein